jgi:hypothetical protein
VGVACAQAREGGSTPRVTVSDLQTLAAAIDAQHVVPIRTAAPQRYRDLFANVEIHEDGSWWPV